ncbi:hypothetical protein CBI38_21330 [Rhodococcus oxybenzonivorans]|uniref:Uncharacterized protein n=1 Tax=Rhodococcus oxybenzonivorans TaxID=1990687 RepID=A0A2S2BYL1_9NOCA|nr:hypothetical protein CBI38_21330 [Rhodococcus oxybenzonivorans]
MSEILSPSGNVNRALANAKRKTHQLLGLKVGNQYRYPLFQFDRVRKQIRSVAEHAKRLMECDLDPWGTLDWWLTENGHGLTPVTERYNGRPRRPGRAPRASHCTGFPVPGPRTRRTRSCQRHPYAR